MRRAPGRPFTLLSFSGYNAKKAVPKRPEEQIYDPNNL
jgi:hypothetical protein